MNRNISPSLLSANFTRLREDIEIVEKLGVDRLHLDVMDGHFVPNLTFGPFIISQIREITDLHLETHLMIEKPHEYIEKYAKAGSDTIIIHYEASKDIRLDIQTIKSYNKLAGIAINPDTEYKLLDSYLDDLDYILIMSVFPGFGGQKFIESTLEAMRYLSDRAGECGFKVGVDGGVNLSTIDKVYDTGIDITIVGSALYGASDIKQRYLQLINEK
jgi:ribulose-phosphate 3-epimerase